MLGQRRNQNFTASYQLLAFMEHLLWLSNLPVLQMLHDKHENWDLREGHSSEDDLDYLGWPWLLTCPLFGFLICSMGESIMTELPWAADELMHIRSSIQHLLSHRRCWITSKYCCCCSIFSLFGHDNGNTLHRNSEMCVLCVAVKLS